MFLSISFHVHMFDSEPHLHCDAWVLINYRIHWQHKFLISICIYICTAICLVSFLILLWWLMFNNTPDLHWAPPCWIATRIFITGWYVWFRDIFTLVMNMVNCDWYFLHYHAGCLIVAEMHWGSMCLITAFITLALPYFWFHL